MQRGDFFTTTGEVLLPDVRIAEESGGRIAVQARILHFPAGNGGDSLGRWHADLPHLSDLFLAGLP